MKIKLFIISLLIVHCSLSQWSTSTIAESALYVCPGFVQDAITYDDGSSVIFGFLGDYRFMQKLDPYGKKVWAQPLQIVHTPGMNSLGGHQVNDGFGGWFVYWGDTRGATRGQYAAFNNALYMQHIDKNGNLLWKPEGIKLADVAGGAKGGMFVNDGAGGCIIHMDETDFLRPGATKMQHTWLVRYNKNGEKVWEFPLDTAFVHGEISPRQLSRIGKHIFLSRKEQWYITDTTGLVFQKTSLPPTVVEGDTAGFSVSIATGLKDSTGTSNVSFRVIRVNEKLDSLWSQEFQILQNRGSMGSFYNQFLPDRKGGLFIAWPSFKDDPNTGFRLYRVTSSGVQFKTNELKVYVNNGIGWGFNGVGEYGIYTLDGKAYKVDTTGVLLLPPNFTVISNPSEAYFQRPYSDNNGGAIVTYWTVLGGIYAQHTGRKGKVGLITKVSDYTNIPTQYELYQNYPNPFNPTTSIQFAVNGDQLVILKIYDLLGREIQTLVNEKLQTGKYEVKWNANNFSSGVYYYSIVSGNWRQTRKMMLVK